jgi:hypothetical protein
MEGTVGSILEEISRQLEGLSLYSTGSDRSKYDTFTNALNEVSEHC